MRCTVWRNRRSGRRAFCGFAGFGCRVGDGAVANSSGSSIGVTAAAVIAAVADAALALATPSSSQLNTFDDAGVAFGPDDCDAPPSPFDSGLRGRLVVAGAPRRVRGGGVRVLLVLDVETPSDADADAALTLASRVLIPGVPERSGSSGSEPLSGMLIRSRSQGPLRRRPRARERPPPLSPLRPTVRL